MKDTFDTLNLIFDKFIADEELPGIIGIMELPSESRTEEKNRELMAIADSKFRRSFADMTVIIPEDANAIVPFVDFSFVPSHSETGNWLVNRETLEINMYVSSVNEATDIYKAIHRIFKENYRDWRCTSPCQAGCPIQGIQRYRFTAKPLVSS